MSIKRRIAEGLAWYSFSDVSITAMNLILTILVIQALGIFEFGMLALVLSAFSLLSAFLDLGISTFLAADISQEIGKGKESNAKSLLTSYKRFEIFSGIIVSFFAFLASFYLRHIYNELVGNMMAAISVFLLLNSIKNIFTVTFHGLQDFKSIGLMNIYEMLFRLLLLLFFLFPMNKGIVFVLLIYNVALLLSLLIMLPKYRYHMKRFGEMEAKKGVLEKYARNHGKWVIGAFPLKRIWDQSPYWITEFFLGVSAVAVLSVAMKFFTLLTISFQSLEGILTPIVSEKIGKSIDSARFILLRNLKYTLWASVAIIVFSILLSGPAVSLLLPQEYLKSIPLFNLLAITLLFSPFAMFLRTFFTITRNQKYHFYVSVIDLPVFIILEILLVSSFGISGIALAFMANGVINLSLRYYFLRFFKHKIKISLFDLCKIDDYDRKLLKLIRLKIRSGLISVRYQI